MNLCSNYENLKNFILKPHLPRRRNIFLPVYIWGKVEVVPAVGVGDHDPGGDVTLRKYLKI